MPQTGTSTAAHARSRRLVSATITVMPTSTRSPRRNRQPSRSCSRYGAGVGVLARLATGRRRGRDRPGQQQRGDAERHGVDDQRVGRPDHRDQAAGERGAEHRRGPLDGRAEPGDPLHRHAGGGGEGRGHRRASRRRPVRAARRPPRPGRGTPGTDRSPASCRSGIAPTTSSEAQSQRERDPAGADPVDDRAAQHLEQRPAAASRPPRRGRSSPGCRSWSARRTAARSSRPGCRRARRPRRPASRRAGACVTTSPPTPPGSGKAVEHGR